MEITAIIAENLKGLRLERNLSLGQLAKNCGVSKVMLSQIEKGDTNPTINTVWKIAKGLKVPYTALLEQQKSSLQVLQKIHTEIQADEQQHYRIYCYYPNSASRDFELFQIELDEGHSYASVGHSPKSFEYIMVLQGTLTLTIKEESFALTIDDSITFPAAAEHVYTNSGQGILKAVIINHYPA